MLPTVAIFGTHYSTRAKKAMSRASRKGGSADPGFSREERLDDVNRRIEAKLREIAATRERKLPGLRSGMAAPGSEGTASTRSSSSLRFDWPVLLQAENEYRLSEEYQELFRLAEERADTDWLEVAEQLQRRVLREAGGKGSEQELLALRVAALDEANHTLVVPLYIKYNRAQDGALPVGGRVDLATLPCYLCPASESASASSSSEPVRTTLHAASRSSALPAGPLVLVTGSLS